MGGEEQEYENDPGLANVVWARDHDQKHVQLSVDPETVRRLHESRQYAQIGDYCGLIHGAVPNGSPGLVAAHALFQGLKRPRKSYGILDDQMFVYVLNPDHSYIYGAGELRRGDGPRLLPKPEDSVFVVYADLKPMVYVTRSGREIATGGQIVFWEWVLAEIENSELPVAFQRRYTKQLW